MWPKIYALFSPDYALETVSEANYCGATMIESYYSTSLEQNAREISLIGSDYWAMPFLKYALWKHKVAKAANLWVKLQKMAGTGIKHERLGEGGTQPFVAIYYLKNK